MAKINYWEKFEESVYYHIYNRGINRTNLFTQEKNYHFFLQKWAKLVHPFCETMAYCLMPNHFHFLVRVRPLSEIDIKQFRQEGTSKSMQFIENKITYNQFLEDQFKRLFSSYALAFNKQENRTGSLFQKRFKRISVKTEHKLWHLLAYIHHNPIHHGFITNFSDWKYSSYNSLVSSRPSLLSREKVLIWFDGNREKSVASFINFHRDYVHVY